jgi:diadenosine tetraphosphatase ApaH/serine/threonine PP2A family protein phosphatase
LATLWTRDQLTPENLEWLRSLPQGPVEIEQLPGLQFVHGSALDEDEYMVSARDAIEPLITNPVPVTFFGHTHLQGGLRADGRDQRRLSSGISHRGAARVVRLAAAQGSALSHQSPARWASLAMETGALPLPVFDSEAWIVTFYRVPYNLRVAQEKILAANLAAAAGTRLATGTKR